MEATGSCGKSATTQRHVPKYWDSLVHSCPTARCSFSEDSNPKLLTVSSAHLLTMAIQLDGCTPASLCKVLFAWPVAFGARHYWRIYICNYCTTYVCVCMYVHMYVETYRKRVILKTGTRRDISNTCHRRVNRKWEGDTSNT
jgi:hypothetical protein